MRRFSSVVWGVILIAVGVIFGLNALDITDIDVFFDGWWTLIIIIPSFVGLFTESDKTGNIIGILIGTILLLACQDIIDFSMIWKLLVPAVLVIIGLSILFKDVIHSKVRKAIGKINKNNDKEYCATFSSQNVVYDTEVFDGCTIDAVFGGVKLDLREAIIKEDVVITVSAVFGGVDIYVPNDIKVKVVSTPIFGGVDNKYRNPKNDKVKTIFVNATCVFGGVDIK